VSGDLLTVLCPYMGLSLYQNQHFLGDSEEEERSLKKKLYIVCWTSFLLHTEEET
jgi:hypothetical protein